MEHITRGYTQLSIIHPLLFAIVPLSTIIIHCNPFLFIIIIIHYENIIIHLSIIIPEANWDDFQFSLYFHRQNP